ncbi:hypothetical protein E4U43_005973 [Claviceps pusilla]|uniref:Uncharacterized protein n=1 Tax=Claviceps pusilla TaxID=123648 RepID=A0A9P7STR8_9HYPO|nr:hypothetical protein E4U43_005973 [Claviceps pusilla]
MQFLTLLLATASVAFAAQETSVPKIENAGEPHWCNAGTTGDNTCEKMGLNTYCCAYVKMGEFQTWRDPQHYSSNGKGEYGCGVWGLIKCA